MVTAKENKQCQTSLINLARGFKLTKWDVLKILRPNQAEHFPIQPAQYLDIAFSSPDTLQSFQTYFGLCMSYQGMS